MDGFSRPNACKAPMSPRFNQSPSFSHSLCQKNFLVSSPFYTSLPAIFAEQKDAFPTNRKGVFTVQLILIFVSAAAFDLAFSAHGGLFAQKMLRSTPGSPAPLPWYTWRPCLYVGL